MRRDLRSPRPALVSLASTRVDHPPPHHRARQTHVHDRPSHPRAHLPHTPHPPVRRRRPSSPFERPTVVSSPDRVAASRVSHPYLRAPPPAFDPFARRPVLDVHPGRARAHDDARGRRRVRTTPTTTTTTTTGPVGRRSRPRGVRARVTTRAVHGPHTPGCGRGQASLSGRVRSLSLSLYIPYRIPMKLYLMNIKHHALTHP